VEEAAAKSRFTRPSPISYLPSAIFCLLSRPSITSANVRKMDAVRPKPAKSLAKRQIFAPESIFHYFFGWTVFVQPSVLFSNQK